MNKEISIWKCKEHGEFETKTKNVPKCPVCKSAKLTFIRNKEIKLRVGGNYWENKANIILNDVELKQIIMPFGIVTKRNSVDFVCCNCREEIRIDENIKGFNCPNCDTIFRKNEDGGYIEQ
jgi:Zn finger protein HypA/HybF involved in hydrogenase expression